MLARLPFILFWRVLLPVDAENYIAFLPVVIFKKHGVSLTSFLQIKQTHSFQTF